MITSGPASDAALAEGAEHCGEARGEGRHRGRRQAVAQRDGEQAEEELRPTWLGLGLGLGLGFGLGLGLGLGLGFGLGLKELRPARARREQIATLERRRGVIISGQHAIELRRPRGAHGPLARR